MTKTKRRYVKVGDLRRGDSVRVFQQRNDAGSRRVAMLVREGVVGAVEPVGQHWQAVDRWGNVLVATFSRDLLVEKSRG